MTSFAPASLLLACAGLTACGGSSDDPAAPPPPPVAGGGGTGASVSTGNCDVANFVPETLALVNAFRAQARTCGSTTLPAAPPLVWNEKLAQAGLLHSQDMAAQNYFAHNSRDGRTFSQRVTAAGYAWNTVGENLAAGPTTLAQVMAGWQNSPGHCTNLMGANFTEIGLSCVKGSAATTYGTYWSMELARPQ